MEQQEIINLLKSELPTLMKENQEIRNWVINLSEQKSADRKETESSFEQTGKRIDRMLLELKEDRLRQDLKWEEQKKSDAEYKISQDLKWEEHNLKWEEQKKYDAEYKISQDLKWEEQKKSDAKYKISQDLKWEEQNLKWEEQKKSDAEYKISQDLKWEEQKKYDAEYKISQDLKWEEQKKYDAEYKISQDLKWDEQKKYDAEYRISQDIKWDEQKKYDAEYRISQDQKWDEVHNEIMNMKNLSQDYTDKKLQSTVGALGARWGMYSEEAFRNGLRAILEESFGVQVLNICDYDTEGTVFGHPEQVELDILIKNGILIICELKSSISKSDLYIFEHKARFYENLHQQKADRLLIISPMLGPDVEEIAKRLNIECYSHASDATEI